MPETKRIEGTAVETHVMLAAGRDTAPESAHARSHADLLEQAVLANAEGWQSGPVDCVMFERPQDLAVVTTCSMEMTRG